MSHLSTSFPEPSSSAAWLGRAVSEIQSALRFCTVNRLGWLSAAEEDQELNALDEHLLDDIGLSHAEILYRTYVPGAGRSVHCHLDV